MISSEVASQANVWDWVSTQPWSAQMWHKSVALATLL